MMSGYTPEPWAIIDTVFGAGPNRSRVKSFFVIGTEAVDDAGAHDHVCIVKCPATWGGDSHHYDVEKTRAMANLIAAAPELLEACKAMRRTMYSPDSEESKLADAAIAKAIGVALDRRQPQAGSPPRFDTTWCSQCGREFGPGDHGYSHCEDHR